MTIPALSLWLLTLFFNLEHGADLLFAKEKVLTKQLNVVRVPAIDQLADILTKALSPLFLLFRSKLRVVERHSSNHLMSLRGSIRVFIPHCDFYLAVILTTLVSSLAC